MLVHMPRPQSQSICPPLRCVAALLVLLADVAGAQPLAPASSASAPPADAAPLPSAAASASAANGNSTSYVIGLVLISAAEYPGSDRNSLKARPVAAYQWGRFRISTSRAGIGGDVAAEVAGPGATAELLRADRWRVGAGLRVDSGRRASSSLRLAGLPDIERTVRGRVYATHTWSRHWQAGAYLSHDLLGKQGGALAGLDLAYRQPFGARSEWSVGVGLQAADGLYMRTYFGITDEQSARTGIAAYRPGAGLRSAAVGVNMSTGLDSHWVAFASASVSTLLGPAAASPLSAKATAPSVSVGLLYRCCK